MRKQGMLQSLSRVLKTGYICSVVVRDDTTIVLATVGTVSERARDRYPDGVA